MYPFCFQTTHPKYIYPSLLLLLAYAYERLASASAVERATARLSVAVGAGMGMLGIATFQTPSLCFQRAWPQLKGLRALDLWKSVGSVSATRISRAYRSRTYTFVPLQAIGLGSLQLF